ncbi:LLM class F420-dependent oxidoreductase [Amycolatopsis sp. GM8]|uniref:LLM class F420-dependent oxidoreductase n=1 Tax=Amycolatopsis sp. GM8 TaxID=2896530 RepID=UPI001F01DC78|nr:LLM class F420-dependent oxidoreductase [Amycolatopsis sp. GM8]
MNVGYSGARLELPLDNILLAERLGYDSVWTAEAYGSDAITPLAFIAAHTKRLRLGTSIMQVAGRPPAMCAMQAQTVDALAGGGRMIAGLGVSGPQIVEGWYGEPWGSPYWRLRDYVEIMRKIFARKGPVSHAGREIVLPYPAGAEGSSGLGKPLKSILHPNPDLPIWLGAGGPATTRLAGELCQGILPLRMAADSMTEIGPWLLDGFAKAGNGKGWDGFEINAMVHVRLTDDLDAAMAENKRLIALYAGGMGAREQNYHNQDMVKAGFAEEAAKIQELFLAGRKEEAARAVPDAYIERRSLFGSPDRIRDGYAAWADSGITGLIVVTDQPEVLRLMARLAEQRPAIGPAAALAAGGERR